MTIQQEKDRFAWKGAMSPVTAATALLSKPLLATAPLVGIALFLASGTQAQTSGKAASPNQPAESTMIVPKPADDAARRGGPKGGGRDKILTNSSAQPLTNTNPTNETKAVVPNEPPAEKRRKGPKGRPSSDNDGSTVTPSPNDTPTAVRRKGPKGDGGSGRTETPPAPDTQPAAGGTKPKGRPSQG